MPAELPFESPEEDSKSARIDDAVDRKGTRKKKKRAGYVIHRDEAAFDASDEFSALLLCMAYRVSFT